MFPIDVLRFSEFRTVRNHLSETLMLNDIQITSDYMSRWVVLKKRVGAVTSQRVLKVLFYVNILQCFFVVEHFTANAVSVAIRDNGNRLIFKIWWNFFYDLFSIKNEQKWWEKEGKGIGCKGIIASWIQSIILYHPNLLVYIFVHF